MSFENDLVYWLEPDCQQYSGSKYKIFEIMEELLELLKRLDYETGFCKRYNKQHLSRHYFVISTNTGEQFNYFICLCSWLLQIAGKKHEIPEETDDPNTILSSILLSSKELNINCLFGINKFKCGYGPHCIWLLNEIVQRTMQIKDISWQMPIYSFVEEDAEITEIYEGEEINSDIEENNYDNGSDFENHISLEDLEGMSGDKAKVSGPLKILESHTDSYEWGLELERVTPQLNIQQTLHTKHWRSRLDQMGAIKEEVMLKRNTCRSSFTKLSTFINNQLEKIKSREKYLEQQMGGNIELLKVSKANLLTLTGDLRDRQFIVSEMMFYLAQMCSDADQIKAQMDEQSLALNSGLLISKIKEATSNLKDEIKLLDLHLGLLQHQNLHLRI